MFRNTRVSVEVKEVKGVVEEEVEKSKLLVVELVSEEEDNTWEERKVCWLLERMVFE